MKTSPIPKTKPSKQGLSLRALMTRHWLVFAAFAAIGGYFLWAEHRAHLMALGNWLPWILIALCPLMHLFMHHGHGNKGGDASKSDDIDR